MVQHKGITEKLEEIIGITVIPRQRTDQHDYSLLNVGHDNCLQTTEDITNEIN